MGFPDAKFIDISPKADYRLGAGVTAVGHRTNASLKSDGKVFNRGVLVPKSRIEESNFWLPLGEAEPHKS